MPLVKKEEISEDDLRLIGLLKKPSSSKKMLYKRYTQTKYWGLLKERMIRLARESCERCGDFKEILDIHHRTYRRIGEEEEQDLIVLCRSCHDYEHQQKIKRISH